MCIRDSGLPVQAKAIVTAAAGHGQPSERLRTALRRSTEEILARPMKPVQTTLVRPQQAGNTAAVRPMETFTDAALQPGETASRRAAVMDGNELSYLPLQPAEQKTDQKASSQASALPDWAQRFLQQPAGADRQNTQRCSAVQQDVYKRQGLHRAGPQRHGRRGCDPVARAVPRGPRAYAGRRSGRALHDLSFTALLFRPSAPAFRRGGRKRAGGRLTKRPRTSDPFNRKEKPNGNRL